MKAIHNNKKINYFKDKLCLIHQRYKMKAIHNSEGVFPYTYQTVFNTSKIQNESNSQQEFCSQLFRLHCV